VDGTLPAPGVVTGQDGMTDPGGDLAWWAEGLLKAVVAADTSDDGEPVLAAVGNAATAALLLVRYHHQQHDDDLRETYDVSADQLAIVRELLHTATSTAAPAHLPAATTPSRPNGATARRAAGSRRRRRRLRLVRSFAR
jgi:hypothetical protein